METLWELPGAKKLLNRQEKDGSWSYHGKRAMKHQDYDQYQTYLNLAELVEKYGLNNRHESIKEAAEYLLVFYLEKAIFEEYTVASIQPHIHRPSWRDFD